MSQALTLARPYARAAFSIGRESLTRDASAMTAWSQALAFAARVAADPQIAALLGNPKLTAADAVVLLAPDGADEVFVNFLGLLFDNRRLALLPEIAGLYDGLRFEAERVVKAKVTSAAVLPAAELETIKAALRRRFEREVEVEAAVDESLIGGAVIDAGEVVIDGSIKGKLGRLAAALSH
jgi:F-type H+-transporting ATPase subunit delta